jgi:N utilization substance protein B
MSRRTSRETAMKILYQMEFHNDIDEQGINSLMEENIGSNSDKDYIDRICRNVTGQKTELDKIIEKHLKGWKISRISRVDLTILRIALFEILKCDDIPVSVSINEAVELAKKYSTPESASFINGVLSSIDKNKSINKEN